MAYEDSLDKYMKKYGNPSKSAKQYNKATGPATAQLKAWSGHGPSNIGSIMLNKALSAEAMGSRSAAEEAGILAQGQLGTSATPLTANMAFQSNLLSQRPTIAAQTEVAGAEATAGVAGSLASLLSGRNAHVMGAQAPYFQDFYAQLAEQQAFPPQPDGGSGGFGDILGGI